MKNNLLLEIGMEEIPSKLLDLWLNDPEKILRNTFISHGKTSAMGTPRRLSLIVDDLKGTQEPITEEIRGPAKNIAYDINGKITDIGKRFAEKCNIPIDRLEIKTFKNAEYVFAIKQNPGVSTKKILEEHLSKAITSFPFPKSMRWEETNFKFPRPIRWIIALWNNEIINFSIAGINSSNISFGHRNKGNKPVFISSPLEYKPLMKRNKVLVDPIERKLIIKKQLQKIANRINAKVIMDEELLEEVKNLVEYPNAVLGTFDRSYLKLPRQVLITVMKIHQKYFSLEDNNNNLLPNFIVVTNSLKPKPTTVISGNEWVLKARLYDANFFWNEDRKIPLENRLNSLNGIVFQYKLGTIFDKVERIKKLALNLSILDLKLKSSKISTASELCKTDLLTEMVKEFPTLQGIMGKEYFLAQHGDPEVAEAVYEHYLPRFSNDLLPETSLGAILSLSDKIDNIASFFLLDKIPTGSEDPFGLRRQANGILQIIWHRNYDISLPALINTACALLSGKVSKVNIEQEIKNFFIQRFRNLLLEEGIKYDCVDAVLAGGFDRPLLDKKRAKAMTDISAESDFKEIVTSFSRVTNILKNISPSIDVKQDLLTENAEKELYLAFQSVKENFAGQIAKNEYHLAYSDLKPLRGPIDNFFNDVLVMDKNKEIQQNRLNLLYNIASMFYKIADFSKIVI